MTADATEPAGVRFDLRALHRAIESERERRQASRAAVARTVRVSASTIARLADADDAEADGVLALVGWLGVAPEEFVVGATTRGEQLAEPGEGMIRVDMGLVAAASGEHALRRRTRTSIQRLVDVAQRTNRSVASLTRRSGR